MSEPADTADSAGQVAGATALRLVQMAEQMRAMANNGLMFSQDPYDRDRYEKLLELVAELLTLATGAPLATLTPTILHDIDYRTPLTGADAAIFDDSGRVLLIQRRDNQKWAMPGGASEVSEAPAAGAAREVWEETGCTVTITHFLGIFDGLRIREQQSSRHIYHLLFAGQVIAGEPGVSNETLDARWFAQAEIPWAAMSPGHGERLRFALRWVAAPETTPAYFDW